MEFNNSRQIIILLTLLEVRRPITSDKLSKIAKSSVRTIKEEIRFLKKQVQKEGMELVSKSGSGYYLQYEDEERFRQFSEYMFSKYRAADVIPTDFRERVNYMIRSFLAAEEYVKFEDLAEDLFVNKRVLSKEMKEAKAMLAYYGIDVETKPGHGMRLKADEYHLRICMVDYFEFYLHRVPPSFRAKGFLELFDFDFEERLQIRKAFMKNLMRHHIVVPDFCSQKLVIHLLLMKSRIRRGRYITFSEEDLRGIQAFPEYEKAEKILEDLKESFDGFHKVNEAETAYLALHLAAGKDVLGEIKNHECYNPYYDQAVELCGKVLDRLKTSYGMELEGGIFEQDMLRILLTLRIKQHFDIKEVLGSPTRTSHIGRKVFESPVCIMITTELTEMLERESGGKLSEYDFLNLAYLIFNYLDAAELGYTPVNLILLAENSKASMASLKRRLTEGLGCFAGEIEILEIYELRGIDLERFGGALTVHNIANFDFPLKIMEIDYYLKKEECEKIFLNMILDRQNWFTGLPSQDSINIYENCQADSIEAFFQLLAFRHFYKQKDGIRFQEHYLSYGTRFNIHSYHEILVICNLKPEKETPILEVYQMAKSLMWNDSPVRYGIYLSLPVLNGAVLKLTEMVARMLTREPLLVKELLEGKRKNFIQEVIGKSMLRE